MQPLFWSTFDKIIFFTQDFTNRNIFDWKIPTNWFQSFNPIFIIILTSYSKLYLDIFREKNIYFSSIGKFTLEILFAGIGFMIMTFASQNLINNNGLPISMAWIIISIFFLTLGELCVSPIGLSIMAKVAPDLIKNQIMELWFVASALGNALAGFIGGKASEENIAYLPNLFYQCMWILLGAVIILLILKKPINKILKN
ncbi:TPA: di-/tripeptide transporter [Campylobacter jejuni]